MKILFLLFGWIILFLPTAVIGIACEKKAPVAQQESQKEIVVSVKLLNVTNGNKSEDREIGHIVVTQSPYGLVFSPHLTGLTPGAHGFHVHENPSCDAKMKDGVLTAGLGAGGHLQSKPEEKHGFPWDDHSHLGDLPTLFVDSLGHARNPVLAPRLKSLSELKGRSLMIHVGGDNHSDTPAPLGGGGARMACGVIAQ